MLSKEPSQITVGQILRALEGNIAPHDCVVDEEFECLGGNVTKHVWMRIKNSIDEVIDPLHYKICLRIAKILNRRMNNEKYIYMDNAATTPVKRSIRGNVALFY